MTRVTKVSLEESDEIRQLPLMRLQLATIGSLTVGLGTVQPGFRWSTHMRAASDEALCRVHHVQLLLSGRFAVQMDDGEYTEIEPNELFDVPPGHDAWVLGDEPAVLLDFLGKIRDLGLPRELDRVVTKLLMTDIVGSTATASRLGDTTWRQLLSDHNRVIRDRLDRYRGHEVNTTGDGFLMMFSSAVGAVRCADALASAARDIGLEIRVGVHTGEVELLPDDIGGVAVHECARIMWLASASEVIVSGTTRTLVEGSDLRFVGRGAQQISGLERPVEVFTLER